MQIKMVVEGNQKAKTAQLTLIVKPKVVIKNLFTDLNNYEVIIASEYTLEAKTETTIKLRLVIEIKTPLNIISITLQDRKERN